MMMFDALEKKYYPKAKELGISRHEMYDLVRQFYEVYSTNWEQLVEERLAFLAENKKVNDEIEEKRRKIAALEMEIQTREQSPKSVIKLLDSRIIELQKKLDSKEK